MEVERIKEYVTKVRKDLFKKLAGPGPINLAKGI
ncbi:MAG: hypothetical protein Ct9H300mP24_8150 [Candidatus Neomarinimicrobiota bacterium]|nr:MAG: hypothetical protein Ct9H300mP24_8150 [Candidatus Neomarinimicrobiota bacterium]